MKDILKGIGEVIANFVAINYDRIQEIFDLAKLNPDGTNATDSVSFPASTLWQAAENFSKTAVAPVAVTFCGIFFAIELFRLLDRNQTANGVDFFYSIIMMTIKMAVSVVVIKNMSGIIALCFAVSNAIVTKSSALLSLTNIKEFNAYDTIVEYFDENGIFLELIFAGITAWFGNALSNVAFILAKLVCQLRFIEIYIFVAMAPIPFCTFCSSEYKQIGIAFIKRILALALQGVFIMVAVFFFTTIVGAIDTESMTNPLDMVWTQASFSILLIIAIFQTGGWAKSLLQVN